MQQNLLQPKMAGIFFALLFIAGCAGAEKRQNPSPPGYDLEHPQVVKLSDKLNEISGLSYYPKDSSLFAIIDEAGVLFKIKLKDGKPDVQQWRFAKHSDFEDVVLRDSTFYAMKSKGDIIAFKFITTDSVGADEYKIPLEGKNEFESLYYDSTIHKLVMICKNCEVDDKTKVSTWAFDPASRSFGEGPYTIEAAGIMQHAREGKKKFKPSGAAIHPITGELYIISSVNKVLVVADTKGKVLKVYPLNPGIYKQPEGIAFTPAGDLFISNEAAGEGLPNLLYFPYKKAVHEK